MERTPKYRTSKTSNINTLNFEHIEHDPQILRRNFGQATPDGGHHHTLMRLDAARHFALFYQFLEKFVKKLMFSPLIKNWVIYDPQMFVMFA